MALNQVTVTIDNVAPDAGTNLTPLWVGFHNGEFDTYDRGRPVSPGLESVAEDGNNALIAQEFALSGLGDVDGTLGGAPLAPSASVRQTFNIDPTQGRFFNYAAMVLPSNDTFIANGNPIVHELFDDAGNFIGADILVTGAQALDAGTEINDELPANTAFFGQQTPDTGVDENGVVQLSEGFNPVGSGGILDDPRFANADFTAPDYQIARIRVSADPSAQLSSLLTADQEPQGGGNPDASGVSEFVLNEFGDALSYRLTVTGLDFGQFIGDGTAQTADISDDVTRLHLHNAPRGENGAVAFGLIDLVAPSADGQDNDDLTIVQNADGSTTLQGIWETTDPALTSLREFVADIENAAPGADIPLYWNIHTNGSPAGALRGQLQEGVEPTLVPLPPANTVIDNRQTETITLGSADTLTVNASGRLDVDGTAVAVEPDARDVEIDIEAGGLVRGSVTGIGFANGGASTGVLNNAGRILSAGRAVNLGGERNEVINTGRIATTATPRDGVIYGDQTAQSIVIENRAGATVDVGGGNQGDAISLELGANVTGRILNAGRLSGRGAVSTTTNSQSSAIRLYWGDQTGVPVSVFDGNIDNSGLLTSEAGATVLIEDQTQLDGAIINSGRIRGGNADNGLLAIDARDAEGAITIENTGRIVGDIFLTAGNDTYDGAQGTFSRGAIFGGAGNDTLLGGSQRDTLWGGGGNDLIEGGGGRNVIEGGTGSDTLRSSAAGRNTFVFGADILQDAALDADTIEGFGRGDRIDLSGYLSAGGSVTAANSVEKGTLLNIELSSGDTISVNGDLTAALRQVEQFV